MTTEILNEPALEAAAAAALPAPRAAEPGKLEKLLKQYDKTLSVKAETEQLKSKLENEIQEALNAGDEVSDKLAERLTLTKTEICHVAGSCPKSYVRAGPVSP